MQKQTALIVHKIAPVWNAHSRVLLLGTMPSPASRSAGFFYMHPQNRFWPLMAKIFNEHFAYKNKDLDHEAAIAERKAFLLRHRIALWDVLSQCMIRGAEDTSITNTVPNDFSEMFSHSAISHVFCTGTTAFRLWQKHCAALYTIPCYGLPSTSPANQGRWPFEKLVEAYRLALQEWL